MFRLNFTNVEEAPVKDFGMKVPNAEMIRLQVK